MKKLTLLVFVLGLLSACTASPATSTGSTDTTPTDASPATGATETVGFSTAQSIIESRCFGCHVNGASRGGVNFDTPEALQAKAKRIKFRTVDNQTMPPGNQTGMTDAERKTLGQWIDQGAQLN